MQKIKAQVLHLCEKCGNVMVTRVLRRDLDFKIKKLEQIQQCVVCKYWISVA
ncbi:MAG: hypothetical protein KGD73_13480 [Candidatus Lokiarchaeota archaeon]|nr:hypothetical protein [Candidatus Lokiarchaeota archaeon]